MTFIERIYLKIEEQKDKLATELFRWISNLDNLNADDIRNTWEDLGNEMLELAYAQGDERGEDVR